MKAALHTDIAAMACEPDDIARPGPGKSGTMKHDEHVLAVPLINLQIVRYRVNILHYQWVIFPQDRYEWDKLADIRLQIRFRQSERFAFLNVFDRYDDIFQPLISSNCDGPKQPKAGPIGQRSAIYSIRKPAQIERRRRWRFAV